MTSKLSVLTFNQVVAGSRPARLTTPLQHGPLHAKYARQKYYHPCYEITRRGTLARLVFSFSTAILVSFHLVQYVQEVIQMTTQLGLFGKAKVEVQQPDPMTTVRVGSRIAQIPLRKRRREATRQLM